MLGASRQLAKGVNMSVITETLEAMQKSRFVGFDDDPVHERIILLLGMPNGHVLEVACAYRAAHLIAAALGRWQQVRMAATGPRRRAKLATTPGRLPCCP